VNDPLISAVLCAYNGARFLGATLDSVLAQSWSAFELIVVDDGSTDETAGVLAAYRDPRMRVIRQTNQGTAAALKAGLAEARGEYVAFLDQDDLWDKEKLAAHLSVHQNKPSLDLTFSWFQVIDEKGRRIGAQSRRFRGSIGFADLLEDFVIAGSSNVVARRSAVARAGGVDTAIARLYDVDLFLRIARLAKNNIEAVPADLMFYRRHPGQITQNLESWKQEWEVVLEKMRQLEPQEAGAREHRARSNNYRYWARLAYEAENYSKSLGFLRAGFASAPAYFLKDPRNWITAGASLCGLLLPRSLHHSLERLAGLDLRAR